MNLNVGDSVLIKDGRYGIIKCCGSLIQADHSFTNRIGKILEMDFWGKDGVLLELDDGKQFYTGLDYIKENINGSTNAQ